jgi:hypothetical protein
MGEGETAQAEPRYATVMALPPHDFSSAVFRAAVYTDPVRVRVRLSVDRIGEADICVTALAPGSRFIVSGPPERPWHAILACEESGQFAVSRAPARPPEAA